ncbi:hypothetical protein BDR06DRAFT_1003465 [Suillus hirtellus]|nr:hypothetical protein BDR06DRAFT_1003465 [Suillus hirtellus]
MPLHIDKIAAAMAAVVFDYCLTLPQEVQLIWGKKWGIVRVLFTLTRYATLMGTAMTTYAAVTDRSKYTSCATFDNVSYVSSLQKVGLLALLSFGTSTSLLIIYSEGLLIFRTWAFWHQNKKTLVWLLVLAAFSILGAVGVTRVAGILHIAGPQTPPADQTGCVFENGKGDAIQYGFLIIYELVLIILTIYKRFNFYKDARGRLATILYRDGMIYMTCIIMASFANILIALVAPGTYADILDAPQLVIHGVLASRILFNLRHENRIASPSALQTPALDSVSTSPDTGASPHKYLKSRYGQYKRLCTFTFSATSARPSATQISVLLSVRSTHSPNYHLYQFQCYWFASAIWEAIKQLFPGYIESTWQGIRSPCYDFKVDKADSVKVVCEEYANGWGRLENEPELRRQAEHARTQQTWMDGFAHGLAQREAEIDRLLVENAQLRSSSG